MQLHNSVCRCAAAWLVGCTLAAAPTLAVGLDNEPTPGVTPTPTEQEANQNTPTAMKADQVAVSDLIDEATDMVEAMRSDPEVAKLLRDAKGVYLVPDYGRVALGIGGEGGSGVMAAHEDGSWTGPGFYDVGGLTAGLEAGVSGGRIAFILMTDRAVDNFKQRNSFSLSVDAGIKVLNYTANAGTSWGKGDVVTWADTQGIFAGAGVGVSDVRWNADHNRQFYGTEVTPASALVGNMSADDAGPLLKALPG
ncbi:lipid-binding SYLF domain-containing protein [Thalassobaculum sp.]|uniref:lipid-binding SYLF domain-containing protein n=1 Tax=Thalassobaculum sp. TaxID=2022740 RepID=UPI0032ECEDAD